MTRLAIDCDLHKIYAVADDGTVVAKADPDFKRVFAWLTLHRMKHPLAPEPLEVLFEIASPVSANRGGQSSAIMYNLAKWMIWNVAQAQRLDTYLTGPELGLWSNMRLLVAPSNDWTSGYPLDIRTKMSQTTQKQKDLRECENMLFFHTLKPKVWRSLPDYLRDL